MEREAVGLLIRYLQVITDYTQDYFIKLLALERALKHHPKIAQEYHDQLEKLRSDRAVQTNRETTSAALESLRTKLFRD